MIFERGMNMAKEKQTRRMIAMALAAAVAMTSMPVAAFAADGGDGGGQTQQQNDNGNDGGNTGDGGDTGDGGNTGDGNNNNIPAAPAEGETPVEKDGPINITVQIPSTLDDPATDEVETGTTNTVLGENEVGHAEGDLPEGSNDDEYDYEVTTNQSSVTVETTENDNGQNNVEFVTGVTGPTGDNDVIYEQDYFDKAEDYYYENELEIEDFLPAPGNEEVTPDELGQLEVEGEEDESRYELITQGATSQFRPLPVFTKPMTDDDKVAEYGDSAYIKLGESAYTYYVKWLEEATGQKLPKENGQYVTDEEGYILGEDGERVVKIEKTVEVDGTTYYMHRFDAGKLPIDGWYKDEDNDGVWEEEPGKYYGVWEEAAQYVLVDKTTGELITVYSEDAYVKKYTVGVDYYMQNLEDSEKFGEYADNIRAVAQAGYWGTAEGVGSLDSMKAMLRNAVDTEGNRLFTDAEIDDSLTDGVALAATQMAIYYYANADFGQEFININYDTSGTVSAGGAVPEGKEDEAALMFKVYDYLKNLAPVSAVTKAEEVITNENFLKGDMEITVLDKVDDGDNDDRNDSYTTNLTFALVVTPSTENGDDLVVKVVNAKTGKEIASGRVAGAETGDETHGTLKADKNGNYTFENIVMTEGDHTYNITMEGVQNLKEGGVYLFTADVPEGTKPQPSMIGMTSDKNVVNVESLNFSFEVEDEKVVVREKHKGSKKNKDKVKEKVEEEQVNIDENDVPLTDLPGYEIEEPAVEDIEIGEEEIPMAEVPLVAADEEVSVIAQTGDSNHMAGAFGGMFTALAGMFMLRRKKEN